MASDLPEARRLEAWDAAGKAAEDQAAADPSVHTDVASTNAAITSAYASGKADERASILAWLRDRDKQNEGGEMYREDAAMYIADAIERGDHLA